MRKFLFLISLYSALSVTAQVDLTSNLRVCMSFNGNANDFSGNNNNGTISGGVALTSDRFSQANKAYQFNGGTNDFISISSFTNIALTNELTISIWAKVDVTTSTCLFILNPDNAGDRCVGCAQYSGVGLVWDYGDIFSNGRVTVSTNSDNNWHHYVYIISQSNNRKEIYMDGIAKYTGAYAGSLVNKNFPFYIGAGASDGGGGSLRWRGAMDDISIYNRALTSNEVTGLYNLTGICTATGIKDLSKVENLQIYPSVSENGIYHIITENKKCFVDIYNADGKKLKSYGVDELASGDNKIDISSYQSGMYILKIYDESSIISKKIIKN
jgi:hypothetical protein